MWAAVRVTTARSAAGASGLQAEILKMNKISMFGMHLRDNVGLSEAIIMLHMQRDRCANRLCIHAKCRTALRSGGNAMAIPWRDAARVLTHNR